MNILFLTLAPMRGIEQRGIYPDLLREMRTRGHHVFAVSPVERRSGEKTHCVKEPGASFLMVRTLNNTKVSLPEKALALVTTPWLMRRAAARFFKGQGFDLLLYSTPPITIASTIGAWKKKFHARTYLMLKDIWPQTGVDLGSLRQGGLSWSYLKRQEEKLYRVSDAIGCMSQGNVAYMRRHNPGASDKLHVLPNAIEPLKLPALSPERRSAARSAMGVPQDAVLFVYGGNLGKPQGISFLIEALSSYHGDRRVFFCVVGNGTEYAALESAIAQRGLDNVRLRPALPKEEYDGLLACSDVGLVFLHEGFTVPNIPSRTLDYMQAGLPVLAAVDSATDFCSIVENAGFGLTGVSGDLAAFRRNVEALMDEPGRRSMGLAGRAFLERNWTAAHACDIIMEAVGAVGPTAAKERVP